MMAIECSDECTPDSNKLGCNMKSKPIQEDELLVCE